MPIKLCHTTSAAAVMIVTSNLQLSQCSRHKHQAVAVTDFATICADSGKCLYPDSVFNVDPLCDLLVLFNA